MIELSEALEQIGASLSRGYSLGLTEFQGLLVKTGLVTTPDLEKTQLALWIISAGLGLALLVAFIKRRGRVGFEGRSLSSITRGPRTIGFLAVAFFFAVISGWSLLAPLASATVASGSLSPQSGRVEIHHLEGGILSDVHVTEGQSVEIGDPLVTFDDTSARAGKDELYNRYHYLLSTKSRLVAELGHNAKMKVPDEIAKLASAEVEQHVAAQQKLLESRHATLALRQDILDKRMQQIDEQVIGFEAVIAALRRQNVLVNQEIESVRGLYERGLERLPRLLELERVRASIDADIAANRARILEAQQSQSETMVQSASLVEQFLERANDELVDIERQLSEIRSMLPTRDDRLARTTIRSPVAGSVLNVANLGGNRVVRPGELLMEVVPRDTALTVYARVATTDIDRVYVGMSARVILTAYKQRNLPQIHGKLLTVSSDALVDDRTGAAYFLATVSINEEDLNSAPEIELVPGMPAEVLLLDEERTLISFLLDPVTTSLERSFLED